MTPIQQLKKILDDQQMSPFLFIGSGFSQRYLGLPTWEGLLAKFCTLGIPFDNYMARADSSLPRCASMIAKEYSEQWLTNSAFGHLREEYAQHHITSSSALKISISHYLKSDVRLPRDPQLAAELKALRALNIEGIITTNWDKLLESLFPDYRVFVGQQSIVRDTPHGIAEIYKIHGCCSDPNSLVVTEEDYGIFQEKQAYLAAKLITIFVEHPIIFIGYSINDPNILDLLKAILNGLGKEEIHKLQQNLIFVQRAKVDRPEGMRESVLYVENTAIPITNLIINDFVGVYTALAESKLKLPARVLRFCAEQLYEVISSKEPSKKLALLNIDEIKSKEDVEFVVGVGVTNEKFTEKGYLGISVEDIFRAVIFNDHSLDGKKVIDQVIPARDQGNNFLPIYRFIHDAGMDPAATNPSVQRLIALGRNGYKTKAYEKAAIREIAGHDFAWIIQNLPAEKAAAFIPYLPDSQIPLDELQQFAQLYFQSAFDKTYNSTLFRKVFCLYDYLRYRLISDQKS